MPLVDIWKATPQQLETKTVQQLLGFAGDGRLRDENEMIVLPFERGHVLVEMRFEMELRRLLNQSTDQILGQDFGEAADVEDVLLGIESSELPSELRQGVDYLGGRSPHTRIKSGEQPRRTAADDRDVDYLVTHP